MGGKQNAIARDWVEDKDTSLYDSKQTMLPVFPSTGSIPPATFYDSRGLSNWLNNNPTYKEYFIGYPRFFPNLYSQSFVNELISTSQIPASSIYANYNVQNVPLPPIVTTLSQVEARNYHRMLEQFQRVYGYNSNAYTQSLQTGSAPIYYRFRSSGELQDYRASVQYINKMYPFDVMAMGVNQAGSTLGWIIPFPL